MTHGIDGGLQQMQAPAFQPPVDPTTAHPEVQQLFSSDDTVLSLGELRYCGIQRLLHLVSASLSMTTYMGARDRLGWHAGSLPR